MGVALKVNSVLKILPSYIFYLILIHADIYFIMFYFVFNFEHFGIP